MHASWLWLPTVNEFRISYPISTTFQRTWDQFFLPRVPHVHVSQLHSPPAYDGWINTRWRQKMGRLTMDGWMDAGGEGRFQRSRSWLFSSSWVFKASQVFLFFPSKVLRRESLKYAVARNENYGGPGETSRTCFFFFFFLQIAFCLSQYMRNRRVCAFSWFFILYRALKRFEMSVKLILWHHNFPPPGFWYFIFNTCPDWASVERHWINSKGKTK